MLNYFQPEVRSGLGRVKTPTCNLRVEIPSRFRQLENQKYLRPLLREDDRENNSAHSCQFRADDAGPKTDRPHEAAIPDLSERLR